MNMKNQNFIRYYLALLLTAFSGITLQGQIAYNTGITANNPNGAGWTIVPGGLKQVSVGPNGTIWGVNSAGALWYKTTNTAAWATTGGALTQLSVGSNAVWGVNTSGAIWSASPSLSSNGTFTWSQIPGPALTQISVGSDGKVWGLNAANDIFYKTSTGWAQISGGLTQISAGNGRAWGVNTTSGTIWYTNATPTISSSGTTGTTTWYQINSPKTTTNTTVILSQISVGPDGTVLSVDTKGSMWYSNGIVTISGTTGTVTWTQINGTSTQTPVSVGPNGTAWGILSIVPTKTTAPATAAAPTPAPVPAPASAGIWTVGPAQAPRQKIIDQVGFSSLTPTGVIGK